jgi:hypothetical protein
MIVPKRIVGGGAVGNGMYQVMTSVAPKGSQLTVRSLQPNQDAADQALIPAR